MYEYQATVVGVYDGDTITVDIDLGLRVWLRGQKLRLFGIDAFELRGDHAARGRAARDYLKTLVLNRLVKLRTHRDSTEKYGRWLADIYLDDGRLVNRLMVDAGHAVEYLPS